VRGVVGVGHDRRVGRGQAVAPLLGVVARAADLEHAGHGLLLEPLPRVARVDPAARGELARRVGPPVAQRGVEAEPVAEIEAEELERPDRRAEHALVERDRGPLRCRARGGSFRRRRSDCVVEHWDASSWVGPRGGRPLPTRGRREVGLTMGGRGSGPRGPRRRGDAESPARVGPARQPAAGATVGAIAGAQALPARGGRPGTPRGRRGRDARPFAELEARAVERRDARCDREAEPAPGALVPSTR